MNTVLNKLNASREDAAPAPAGAGAWSEVGITAMIVTFQIHKPVAPNETRRSSPLAGPALCHQVVAVVPAESGPFAGQTASQLVAGRQQATRWSGVGEAHRRSTANTRHSRHIGTECRRRRRGAGLPITGKKPVRSRPAGHRDCSTRSAHREEGRRPPRRLQLARMSICHVEADLAATLREVGSDEPEMSANRPRSPSQSGTSVRAHRNAWRLVRATLGAIGGMALLLLPVALLLLPASLLVPTLLALLAAGVVLWLVFLVRSPRARGAFARWMRSDRTSPATALAAWAPGTVCPSPGWPPPLLGPDLQRLSTEELCQAWCASYLVLMERSAGTGIKAVMATVQERQRYLDELERRNPIGLAAWFASGARVASNPLPYLLESPSDRPGINWEELR